MSTSETRILHLHVPRAAGTSLRVAFSQPRHHLKVYPHTAEHFYKDAKASDFDVFSGHFGFNTASRLGGRIVAIFRNPLDRFVSTYCRYQQLSAKGIGQSAAIAFAARFPLHQFAQIRDERGMLADFHNRMTWQMAGSHGLVFRDSQRLAGRSDEDVLAMACGNLANLTVIGVYERLRDFMVGLQRHFELGLGVKPVNVNRGRVALPDIPLTTRREIHRWIDMDMAFYEQALALSFQPHAQPKPA
jgi:hypothetical protein